MSFVLTKAVWLLPLKHTTKIVALRLADMANNERKCWPSQKRIAADCGMSERSAGGALAELSQLGLIRREKRTHRRGARTSDMITVCPDAPADPHAPADRAAPPATPKALFEALTPDDEPPAQPAGHHRHDLPHSPGRDCQEIYQNNHTEIIYEDKTEAVTEPKDHFFFPVELPKIGDTASLVRFAVGPWLERLAPLMAGRVDATAPGIRSIERPLEWLGSLDENFLTRVLAERLKNTPKADRASLPGTPSMTRLLPPRGAIRSALRRIRRGSGNARQTLSCKKLETAIAWPGNSIPKAAKRCDARSLLRKFKSCLRGPQSQLRRGR